MATILLVARREPPPIETRRIPVDVRRAGGFIVLLGAELASIAGLIPPWLPLLLAAGGAVLLGRRLFETDFSLVLASRSCSSASPGWSEGSSTRRSTPSVSSAAAEREC